MSHLTIENEDTFASLLEFAANNDVEGCRKCIDLCPSNILEFGPWYGRREGSKSMVLQNMTVLMVASLYGNIDVLELILSFSELDVNHSCSSNKRTALHYAASSGSINAVNVVILLLSKGADPNLVDVGGRRPLDIIVVPPNCQAMRSSLEKLLTTVTSFTDHNMKASAADQNSPPISPSSEFRPPTSASDSNSSPNCAVVNDVHSYLAPERKEYAIDPTLPDLKNSIYSTDEFRIYSFKVRSCSRAYSHDWTECPFVHPGENARRRDPRNFHYSCVPCPDFRKGSCQRGDMCEYAHGVFECWLHPAQYRTRLCKDGTNCDRKVCFFAHGQEEIRSLYHSMGSAVPSPGSAPSSIMEFAATMSVVPGSPSSVMTPAPFTPPMSPSNGMLNLGWPTPYVPPLHHPGNNLQSSRLRSSFNARNIPPEDLTLFQDFAAHHQHLANDISRLNIGASYRDCSARSLNSSNLDDIFSAESSSPRYHDQSFPLATFSPTRKSAVGNQLQQQKNIFSPVNTNLSQNNGDHTLLQGSYAISSPGRMSPRHMEPISLMSSQAQMFSQRDRQCQQFLSSRDLGFRYADVVDCPVDSLPMSGRFTTKPDWGASPEELARLKKSNSFELRNNLGEVDLSWVQSLVNPECPEEMNDNNAPGISSSAGVGASPTESSNPNSQFY